MIAKTCVFTIISSNYASYANTLARSVRQLEPSSDMLCLITDLTRTEWETSPSSRQVDFTPCFAEEVIAEHLFSRAMKYNITEFNTSVKPDMLLHLLERYDQVVYLDPDICVFSSLQPLFGLLERFSIVLTPHMTQPVTDAFFPNEQDMLRNGSYNLGFIALSSTPEAKRFARWWRERLLNRCFVAPQEGMFTDQKWIDLVPSLFEGVHVLRDVGYNVAYWNLHYRYLQGSEGSYTVNDMPLVFFHFSGFNARYLTKISKYQNRFDTTLRPDVGRIYREYARKVEQARVEQGEVRSYRFGGFDNGETISDLIRKLYHSLLESGELSVQDDPFRASGVFYTRVQRAGLLGGSAEEVVNHEEGRLIKKETFLEGRFARPHRMAQAGLRGLYRLLGAKYYGLLMKYFNLVSSPTQLAEPFRTSSRPQR